MDEIRCISIERAFRLIVITKIDGLAAALHGAYLRSCRCRWLCGFPLLAGAEISFHLQFIYAFEQRYGNDEHQSAEIVDGQQDGIGLGLRSSVDQDNIANRKYRRHCPSLFCDPPFTSLIMALSFRSYSHV